MGKDDAAANGEKMFSENCFAVLLMTLGVTSITKAQYDMMSALDGTRTASAFQHQFRSVTARAKELKARIDAGETFSPVQPATAKATSTKKRSAPSTDDNMTPPATPVKKAKSSVKAKPTSKGHGKKVVDDVPKGQDSSSDNGYGLDGHASLVSNVFKDIKREDYD